MIKWSHAVFVSGPFSSVMKHLFETVRIVLMAGAACTLLAGLETTSVGAVQDWRPASPNVSAHGLALMLGAYGFLIMMRRRMPR